MAALTSSENTLFGSLSNDDVDVTENGKKSIGLDKEETLALHGHHALRWLDWIFWWGYLPSLSINYVATSKDMEKRLPQLYYVKMKISYDLVFIAIGVAMAT